MKFFLPCCVVALATIVCSQPLIDTVQPNHRPLPSSVGMKPLTPPVIKPTPQVFPPISQVEEINYIKPHIPEVIVNIIESLKPDVEYFNGKVVLTPKYPTY